MNETNLNELILFHQGNIPLIISVPHGGELKLDAIPNRVNGILGIDLKTIELAKELIESIQEEAKSSHSSEIVPSFVIAQLHRSKIDFNREEANAFNHQSLLAKKMFNFYHQKLKEYTIFNLKTFNSSLLVDIHGFERNKRPKGYRDVDIVLGSNNLKSIMSHPVAKKDWGKNIRGDLIKAFNKESILIAPGHHLRKEYMLTGGFITLQYGANNFKNCQSLQIEFSDRVRLYNASLRKTVVETFARTLYHCYVSKFI